MIGVSVSKIISIEVVSRLDGSPRKFTIVTAVMERCSSVGGCNYREVGLVDGTVIMRSP